LIKSFLFICEAESVTAVAAEKFRVPAAMRNIAYIVACEKADRRMLDKVVVRVAFKKSVAAMTGIFRESVAFDNFLNLVPEQVAKVANLFKKRSLLGVKIMRLGEEQRVAALPANKFNVTIARAHSRVTVAVDKA
jgi:hypothetical protein